MDTNTNQHDDGDERLAGDLLVGADAIKAYLIFLGWPEDVDVYYLKRAGVLPIGKLAAGRGGKLVGSKRRIARQAQRITAPAA